MEVDEPVHSEKALVDIELVERARAGDQKAFARLLARYRDSIYFMLLKMVGNKSDAEDLTIEAFGKAFRNIDLYSTTFAFSTWLFKIASNNGIDFLRRKRGKLVSLDGEGNDENSDQVQPRLAVTDDAPDPSEALIKQQTVEKVRSIVLQLKPRYQELVDMRYFQELSYDEIAERLQLPVGTVKAQLYRSRELLYNILKNSEHSPEQ